MGHAPAAHATSIAFDLLGGARRSCWSACASAGAARASLLAFAWAAYPFTAYTLDANTNDAIMPAFLLLGFWLVTSDWARGAAVALAGWTKFGALLVAPLWAHVSRPRAPRASLRFAAAFVVATVLAFAILLLEPSSGTRCATFWDRTIGYQAGARLAVLDLGLGPVPRRGHPRPRLPAAGRRGVRRRARACVLAFVPQGKGPVELAALTAAVLVAFQLTLTHWFYLYLPWVVPVRVPLAAPAGADERIRRRATRTASIEEALPGLGVAVDDGALDPHAALSGLEANGQSLCACAGSRARPRRRSRSRAGRSCPRP